MASIIAPSWDKSTCLATRPAKSYEAEEVSVDESMTLLSFNDVSMLRLATCSHKVRFVILDQENGSTEVSSLNDE